MKNTLILIKGVFAAGLSIANTVIMAIPFFTIVITKMLIPIPNIRGMCSTLLITTAERFNKNNALVMNAFSSLDWRISGLSDLNKDEHYMVTSNHQSWADILVLQHILEDRIPFLKFFIKKELIWVPILGAAMWALDYPLMRRYSKEYLIKHPEDKGLDLIETKRMCEKFKSKPVSVMNFLEGTRFNQAKKKDQNSPYENLLKPRAGGAALVFSSMGKQITSLVDVTLKYDVDGGITFWKLYSGQVRGIDVCVRNIPIPEHFSEGDYENDQAFREEIKEWIEGIWISKDKLLNKL